MDESLWGPGLMIGALEVQAVECFAYSQLENSVHLIIPEADVARMLKGAGLMLGGAFKSFGGVMLALGSTTVSWTGIGIPGIGAGIFVTEAGIFDMSQGVEEFFLGMSGDSTTLTRNKMCDWYYDGNEEIYHLSTGVAAAAGSMLTSYVNAAYGKTAVTGTATVGSTAEKPAVTVESVAEKPAVTETAGGTTDDALEQFYDDIFESSYGEQFDPVGEQAIAGGSDVGNIAPKLDTNNIPNMTKQDIIDSIPDNWSYTENNGFVHIRDVDGNIRIRIDLPDKITNYPHVHVYDSDGNLLNSFGNIVGKKSPDGHIPYKNN